MEASNTVPQGCRKGHKARKITEEEWEKQRDNFTRLYITEAKHLEVVRRIMAESYGFSASTKQCKSAITRWGLGKNLNRRSFAVMVETQRKQALEGEEADFRLGGKLVGQKTVERARKRYKSVGDQSGPDNSIAASTPSLSPGTFSDDFSHEPAPQSNPFLQDPEPRIPEGPGVNGFLDLQNFATQFPNPYDVNISRDNQEDLLGSPQPSSIPPMGPMDEGKTFGEWWTYFTNGMHNVTANSTKLYYDTNTSAKLYGSSLQNGHRADNIHTASFGNFDGTGLAGKNESYPKNLEVKHIEVILKKISRQLTEARSNLDNRGMGSVTRNSIDELTSVAEDFTRKLLSAKLIDEKH